MSAVSKDQFNIAQVEFTSIHVRGPPKWVFVAVSDGDGHTGLAELAGSGAATEIAKLTAEYAEQLRLSPPVNEADVTPRLGLTGADLEADRAKATAVSALRTAISDAQARRDGVGLTEFLGGQPMDSVMLYGNLNRSMLPDDDGPRDRSPEAFGRAAHEAIRRGYGVVKCAPFDEVRSPFEEPGLPEAARSGIDRIAAVRDAIGPDIPLFVDCHSRFDLDSGIALEIILRESNVSWYEEAVDGIAHPEVMKRIREHATMAVAGAESGYGVALFRRIIEGGVMDVVMPGDPPRVASLHEVPGGLDAASSSGAAIMASRDSQWWRYPVGQSPERVETDVVLSPPRRNAAVLGWSVVIEDDGRATLTSPEGMESITAPGDGRFVCAAATEDAFWLGHDSGIVAVMLPRDSATEAIQLGIQIAGPVLCIEPLMLGGGVAFASKDGGFGVVREVH